MATYLVTGGCGFIGSHLAAALVAEGHAVRILDDLSTGRLANAPPGAVLVRGDVADPAAVMAAMDGVDGCFHLAAVASVERGNLEWLGTHRTNLTGTIAVLDAARRARPRGPARVVYASSAAVYGDNPATPLEEDARPRPLSRPTAPTSWAPNSTPPWGAGSMASPPAACGSSMSMDPVRTRPRHTQG